MLGFLLSWHGTGKASGGYGHPHAGSPSRQWRSQRLSEATNGTPVMSTARALRLHRGLLPGSRRPLLTYDAASFLDPQLLASRKKKGGHSWGVKDPPGFNGLRLVCARSVVRPRPGLAAGIPPTTSHRSGKSGFTTNLWSFLLPIEGVGRGLSASLWLSATSPPPLPFPFGRAGWRMGPACRLRGHDPLCRYHGRSRRSHGQRLLVEQRSN